jgi:integrase
MTTRRKPEARVYWRAQGGHRRAYIDVRDLNGKREPLRLPGEPHAVTDPREARQLARVRVEELEIEAKRNRAQKREARMLGLDTDADLEAYATIHLGDLETLVKQGTKSVSWVRYSRVLLRRAVHYFCTVQPSVNARAWARRSLPAGARNLATISTADVQAFVGWLESDGVVEFEQSRSRLRTRGRVPAPFGPATVRQHLAALSTLYTHAARAGHVAPGFNPVEGAGRPAPPRSPTEPFEPAELALLLEGARLQPEATPGRRPVACLFPLLAALIYTGGRLDEVLRLEVKDVDFEAGVVRLYSTKTAHTARRRSAEREVPMTGHLRAILRAHMARLGRTYGLLFTSERTGGKITDFRKAFRTVATRAGFDPESVNTRRFRVSYGTHRAGCAGVTIFDVRDELGHASLAMLDQVYGRGRREKVSMGPELDYRIERYADRLGERLERLRKAG